MRRMSEKRKKTIIRIIMLIMAIVMVLSFVLLPLAKDISADDDVSAVVVTSFETGKLSEAIETAKDGTDLNLITQIAVSGGSLNAADYQAICGYPNIEFLELAGCQTENGVIPANALSSRNQLLFVSLPANTETIGERAFSGNRTVIKFAIPDTLRNIGDYAFEGCEKVEEFNLPAELQTIGTAAFSDCKSLKMFSIPEAVTEISDYCFSKSSIKRLDLGPQVVSIGNGAFSDCHDLADIYFYGKTAFSANESAFQNLRVTIHTYDGGEGFDSLTSNFVSISYDLDENMIYIPPKPAKSDEVYNTTAAETEASETEVEDEAVEEEETVATTVTEPAKQSETEAADTSAAPTPAPATSGSFSGLSVAIIAVLCAALAVTVTLLVVNKKK